MVLTIETPDTRVAERDYILSVVLGELIGLPWRRVSGERRDVRITLDDHSGEIRLPDILFSVPDDEWLLPASMPHNPLLHWDTRDFADVGGLTDRLVPVIYGSRQLRACDEGGVISLPVDILGSAFFMLTRYEELVTPDRDEHDRFPAWASLSYKQGFLERPIIDEYVEILWAAITMIGPGVQRRERRFQTCVSHDVDSPSRYAFKSVRRMFRATAGDLLKRGAPLSVLRGPWVKARTRDRLHPADPHNTFSWLMDVSEKNDLASAFYFICGRTDPGRDADYDPESPPIRDLMRNIHERGHEIGLHPSYNSFRDPEIIVSEASRLRNICVEEGITQRGCGGRMHFLRWTNPVTLRGWERAKMRYDSTLGYADRPGFRCGTCQEYSAFDLLERRPMNLLLRPLIVMEYTVLSTRYMDKGAGEEAYQLISDLKGKCRMLNGTFSLLWHNSQVRTESAKRLYESILCA